MRSADSNYQYKTPSDLPAICTVKEIASFLGVAANNGYKIMKRIRNLYLILSITIMI
jgi:hypothetical protein